MYTTPIFWLCILMVTLVALLPDLTYDAIKMTVWPTDTDKARLAEKLNANTIPSGVYILKLLFLLRWRQ